MLTYPALGGRRFLRCAWPYLSSEGTSRCREEQHKVEVINTLIYALLFYMIILGEKAYLFCVDIHRHNRHNPCSSSTSTRSRSVMASSSRF